MSESGRQWTQLLVLTALLLSLAVLAQLAARHAAAYLAAPRELAVFLDVADSSIAENESCERDVARVRRLEDKVRLARLLREIQTGSDDVRELLGGLLVAGDGGDGDGLDSPGVLRAGARLLWASKRGLLEERVRRLDMLRMRFLVVYMGIVAAGADGVQKQAAPAARDPEKAAMRDEPRPVLPRALTEGIKQKPPMRRLTTQAIGHADRVEGSHRMGWAGVVQELRMSPLMHKRHASVEGAINSEPSSP